MQFVTHTHFKVIYSIAPSSKQNEWIILISQLSSRLKPGCFLSLCLVEPLSSVSSLEVHFDLLDLTELTDMSDQELAEVFADSDEENHNEFPAGKNSSKCKHIHVHLFKANWVSQI